MALAVVTLATPGDAASPQSVGSIMQLFATLTFSGSYATGGEAWDPLPLFGGLASAVLAVTLLGEPGYGFEYDKVNKKLKLFSSANTELAAGAYNAAVTGDTNIVAQVFAR